MMVYYYKWELQHDDLNHNIYTQFWYYLSNYSDGKFVL